VAAARQICVDTLRDSRKFALHCNNFFNFLNCALRYRMIRQSGRRFSEKTMLEQQAKANGQFNLQSFRFGGQFD